MKKKLTRSTGLLVGTVVALAMGYVSPISASAEPVQCSSGYNGTTGAWAQCGGGSGTYRVTALCQNIFTRSSWYVYGPWMTSNGNPSTVNCGSWWNAIVPLSSGQPVIQKR